MKRNIILMCLTLLITFINGTHVYGWRFLQPREPKCANVPVIMYHLITERAQYVGKHGITPDEMEQDLKYLKENGYETVDVSDLTAFVERGRALPDKPIMLTFDDANSSEYRYLLPLLKKYEMKAVAAVLGKAVDECSEAFEENPNQPHLTWDQVKELHKSKLVEIQNHSYNLHGGNGSGKLKGESEDDYKNRLSLDLEKLQDKVREITKDSPTAFAYPLGIISDGSKDVLKAMGIKASFSCWSGMNIIVQGDEDCLFGLKRVNRSSGYPVSNILKDLEKQ